MEWKFLEVNIYNFSLFKAVSYFIHIMDPISSRDYVVVYFHTLVAEENSLPMSFLRDMYEMLDIKYVFFYRKLL